MSDDFESEDISPSEIYHNLNDDESPTISRETPVPGLEVVGRSWITQGIQDTLVFDKGEQRFIDDSLRSELLGIIGIKKARELRKWNRDIVTDAVKSPSVMLDYLSCAVFSKLESCAGCVDNPKADCANKYYRDFIRDNFTIEELAKLAVVLKSYSQIENLCH